MNNNNNNNDSSGTTGGQVSVIRALDTSGSTETTATIESTHEKIALKQEEDMSTTKFLDDTGVVKKDDSMMDYVSEQFLKLNDSQPTEQDIISFLAKPVVISTGTFNTTDSTTTFTTYSFPYTLFSATEADAWVYKLRGFYGIRCTINLKLVVNATRFQQGRYALGFIPTAGANGGTTLKDAVWVNMHNYSLVQRTQTHHVEVDLSTDTSCELTIPFTYVSQFYPLPRAIGPLATSQGNIGWMTIWPYSPLVDVAGAASVGYTVYASLTDVTLYGAAAPQSNISRKETANKTNGVVSGPLFAFSRAFNELRDIPLLSSYAIGASWITERAGKVAKIFGWSKPTQGDSLTKTMILNNPGHSTVDGDNDARPLGLINHNSTVPLKGISGTKYDEMDFSFWYSKKAYFKQFNWTTSNSVGNRLLDIGVTPLVNVQIVAGVYNFPPVSLLANCFQQWRGSLVYRFKLVKTEFHSGRLAVCYYPGDEIGTNRGVNYQNYVNRTIIDIRTHNEFEITVPFVCRDPWCVYTYTGNLSIFVIEPLVAPATVSNTVTVLCEIAGGKDFEVSIPTQFNYVVGNAGVPQSGMDGQISDQLGSVKISSDPIVASAVSIGEKVTSFRSMLKRFYPLLPVNRSSTSTNRFNQTQLAVNTDMILCYSTTTSPPADYIASDFLSVIASCFAMWGGGIRIKDVLSPSLLNGVTTGKVTTSRTLAAYAVPVTANRVVNFASSYIYSSVPRGCAAVYQDYAVNNTLTVENPQYTSTLKRATADLFCLQSGSATVTGDMYTNSATRQSVVFTTPFGLGIVSPAVDNYDLHNLFRAMSDDGNLSCFISIPPLFDPFPGVYTAAMY